MTVHFTSDLHVAHRFVSETRGFASVEEHDEALADAWRSVVRPRDSVWVLGDVAVSSPARALALLATLPGEKHLVWGNHDGGHPMHRDAHRKAARYLDVFASAQAFARRRVDGREVLLSHFPYDGDTKGREADRHGAYRLRDEGVPLLHGHTHADDHLTWSRRGTLQVHVGVDVVAHALAPVSLDEVAATLRTYAA
ncbi:metallophosphoesterase [Cellulosimicrobium sp. TH-20]|uniref:metallophosphoesterase n=1 Tax=Cellulosimicrobium sp. TH-20 TaxID=1980001 RepID=UPI0011AA6807|nr:metallophosphoesterase [Cellulosimicrobium sp. TH-20]